MVEHVLVILLHVVRHAMELHQEHVQASRLIIRLELDERTHHLGAHQSSCWPWHELQWQWDDMIQLQHLDRFRVKPAFQRSAAAPGGSPDVVVCGLMPMTLSSGSSFAHRPGSVPTSMGDERPTASRD